MGPIKKVTMRVRWILDFAHYSASVSDFPCVNMNSLPYPQRKILLLAYLEAILIFDVLNFSVNTSTATCWSFHLTNRSFLFLRSVAVVKTQRHATNIGKKCGAFMK